MIRISAVALPSPIPGALVNPIRFSPSSLILASVPDPEFDGG